MYFCYHHFKGIRGRRGAVTPGYDYKATVLGSVPTLENDLLFIDILISSFWY